MEKTGNNKIWKCQKSDSKSHCLLEHNTAQCVKAHLLSARSWLWPLYLFKITRPLARGHTYNVMYLHTWETGRSLFLENIPSKTEPVESDSNKMNILHLSAHVDSSCLDFTVGGKKKENRIFTFNWKEIKDASTSANDKGASRGLGVMIAFV